MGLRTFPTRSGSGPHHQTPCMHLRQREMAVPGPAVQALVVLLPLPRPAHPALVLLPPRPPAGTTWQVYATGTVLQDMAPDPLAAIASKNATDPKMAAYWMQVVNNNTIGAPTFVSSSSSSSRCL